MSSVIEPIRILSAKGVNLVATPEGLFTPEELAALAASSEVEQPISTPTVAPPIEYRNVAQIPAVDYPVDEHTPPKTINCTVLTSVIRNPG